MTRLLHLSVSARQSASVSRRVGQAAIARFQQSLPDLAVCERDLARQPLPHPDEAFVTASLTRDPERGPEERAELALSDQLIAELERSDLVLLSTPMHNFSVPSALKAWIDQVVRRDRTFRITPSGKLGLLQDRPVFVVVACGGRFGDHAGAQTDFLSPYLHYVFETIGITSVDVLRLESLSRGGEALELAFEKAERWIEDQGARLARYERAAG